MRSIPAVLDEAIGFNLYRTALLFRRELLRALAGYALTPEQWQVMAALWSTREPLNQNDIAHLTLRDKHTASRILARLERDGWVERTPDPEDRRAVQVRPTAWADARREAVPRALVEHFGPILGALSGVEQRELLRLLGALRGALGDRGGAAPDAEV